ncbi:hypothetical protein F5888DRAFT_1770990 [Russula emetica]|nr:hypothetical protein F5888DRAFT_1770990 [Russula emetica]
MTGDFTLHLPKLSADGSNWITYRDRIKWTITMRGLGDHLTDDKLTQGYRSAGDIGGLKPEQRWTADKIAVNQIFGATIPDLVFNQIKSSYEPKDVWDKLKALFEGKSRSLLLADLRERLSSLGRVIGDAEYTSVILGSLPPSYDPAVDSLANSYEASDKDLTPTARNATYARARTSPKMKPSPLKSASPSARMLNVTTATRRATTSQNVGVLGRVQTPRPRSHRRTNHGPPL